jgi:hypothetical protein
MGLNACHNFRATTKMVASKDMSDNEAFLQRVFEVLGSASQAPLSLLPILPQPHCTGFDVTLPLLFLGGKAIQGHEP